MKAERKCLSPPLAICNGAGDEGRKKRIETGEAVKKKQIGADRSR
jgi:hypothetical protein